MNSGLVDSFAEPLLDADQLAERLNAPGADKRARRRWIYRAVERGCPAIRLGSRLYFRASAVEQYLDTLKVGEWGAA